METPFVTLILHPRQKVEEGRPLSSKGHNLPRAFRHCHGPTHRLDRMVLCCTCAFFLSWSLGIALACARAQNTERSFDSKEEGSAFYRLQVLESVPGVARAVTAL